MNKVFLYLFVIIMLFGLLTSCSQETDKNVKNKSGNYGVIFTSYTSSKSIIKLYSEDWKESEQVSLKVGGLQQSQIYKGKLYAPVLGTPASPDNRILIYDFEKRKAEYIKTEAFPIKLRVKDDFVYVLHNTAFNKGTITKISLKTNKVISKNTVNGTIKDLAISKENIYVIADNVKENDQSVYILNSNLKIQKTIRNNKTAFTTDTAIIGQTLYLMNVAKSDFSMPTNLLTELDTKTDTIKTSHLNDSAPYQVFSKSDDLLITHYNPPSDTGKHLSVINKDTKEIKDFALNNNLYRSLLVNGTFISLDSSGKVYEYDTKDYKLKNQYKLKVNDDIIVNDIFFKK